MLTDEQRSIRREYARWYMRLRRSVADYTPGQPHRIDFSNHATIAQRHRDFLQAPRVIDGETFIPTAEAARLVGKSRIWLCAIAREYPGANRVIVLPNGWRFIRCPRHEDEKRAPLYWKID